METAYPDPTAPDSSQNQTPAPAAEAPSISLEQLAEQAKEVLGTMLPLLSFEAKLTANIEPTCVRIHMECEDAGRLIGRRGATVNEIQFLLNRILQRRNKLIPRIFLDVDGFKEEKTTDDELLIRIKTIADQVRRWGEPVDTDLLSQADRQKIEEFYVKDKELQILPIHSKDDAGGMQRVRIQLRK
jgi:spoIIIJ-associated protein